jgi:hypothetical protein
MIRTESYWQLHFENREIGTDSFDFVSLKRSSRVMVSSRILGLNVDLWGIYFSNIITVLPSGVRQRLISELDKRFDLDIDNILDSPKLRLQLSPAELDKRLLELYKKVADGPSGDVLRIIGGGGGEVALQDLYIKRQAERQRAKNRTNKPNLSFGPFVALGEESGVEKRTASQWVNWALRRNLPRNGVPIPRSSSKKESAQEPTDGEKSKMSMSLSNTYVLGRRASSLSPGIPFSSSRGHFCPPRKPAGSSFSLLI